jgi:hypothetical protein
MNCPKCYSDRVKSLPDPEGTFNLCLDCTYTFYSWEPNT